MPEARPEVACLKQHFLSKGSGKAVKDVGGTIPSKEDFGLLPG